MTDQAHADVLNETAQGQLRSFIERVENLTTERQEVGAHIRDVLAEAKSQGFDPRIIRKVVSLRGKSRAARQEEEALLDLYAHAAGLDL
ncbi:DUF2312 domain-containing protein [Phenylobacterium sp.]|uniref:DUF2312 domain-containing protein n=1 Tax=Phenylobacterium sp. TaxID=1871053 RepID=UPI00272F546F|nr:DUF2312 domain-containing protein [Phenylobacterium sp.]MDP1873670.1 DUF2312 domain-containing protein [Phenylobacterium sp.]